MEVLDWFLKLAGTNPFLAFCVLWLIGCIAGVIFKIVNRILRTIRVARAGWPPPHLDADGDWKPAEETD